MPHFLTRRSIQTYILEIAKIYLDLGEIMTIKEMIFSIIQPKSMSD